MSINSVSRFSQVIVSMYELDEKGHIKPNPLFHRPIDKLHSRCVEYPFAASRIGDAKCILDVGTIKADQIWIDWLNNLPMEVHATDYDAPSKPFKNITFHQADVRQLPLPDNYFDKVIAVSVIEHVGLEAPQVFADTIPKISNDGDLDAVNELARVLKHGGELIMTVPFGVREGLILGNQARNYTIDTIRKFEHVLDLVHIEYYEYQAKDININERQKDIGRKIINKLAAPIFFNRRSRHNDTFFGEATWRNIPLESTKALHGFHLEGVVCGIWKKTKH